MAQMCTPGVFSTAADPTKVFIITVGCGRVWGGLVRALERGDKNSDPVQSVYFVDIAELGLLGQKLE